jgi:hypothetical protein
MKDSIIPMTFEGSLWTDKAEQFLKDFHDVWFLLLGAPNVDDETAKWLWLQRVAVHIDGELKDIIAGLDRTLESIESLRKEGSEEEADELLVQWTKNYIKAHTMAYEHVINKRVDEKKLTNNIVELINEFSVLTEQEKPKSKKKYVEAFKSIVENEENAFFSRHVSTFIQSLK